MPLFPSYLFMCGGRDERSETLGTHRAANVIQVFDQQGLKEQLRQIHRVTTSGKPVVLYPGLKRGSRCRDAIDSGSMGFRFLRKRSV